MDERDEKRWANAESDLRDMVCGNCRDYKGMTTCEADDCGDRYCIFCDPDNHADHPYYPIED
jgi:hypothetical protein